MKLSCTQENLNRGLNIVSHLSNKNSNLPILANTLLKVEDKVFTLSATNLEIGVTAQVRSKIEESGSFTLEGRLLSDYISLLPKERIDLKLSEDNIKLECQNQKTKIKGQPATDFPLIPKLDKYDPYIVSVKDFKKALTQVIFAVSTAETRPELSGVLMHFNDQELCLVATDGYRLAEKKIKLNIQIKEEKKIIVPVKTLQEMARILGIFKEDVSLDNVDNLEMYLSDNQIMFSYNGVDLVSRLIEGQYPDYSQITPTTFTCEVKVATSALIKAVKTSSLFTKSGIYDIKLEFTSQGEIIITSSSAQSGENTSVIDAVITGQDNKIVLNYKYLLDGLQNIDAEQIIIQINNSNSPCLIKPDSSQNYIYVVMPIRQHDEQPPTTNGNQEA